MGSGLTSITGSLDLKKEEFVRKIGFLLVILAVLFVSVSAQEKEGEEPQKKWFFELRGLKFFIGGVNEQVGNIVSYRETRSVARNPMQLSERLDYSFKKTPLLLTKTSIDFRGEARYRVESSYWLSVRGSYISTESSNGGVLATPPPYGTDSWHWSGVEFWDANIFALYNDLYPSNAADITYSASDVFRVWSVEAFLYTDYLPFYAGVRFTRPYSELGLKITQTAHRSGSRGYGYEYNNDATLRSVHKSDFGMLAGPVFGLELSKDWGKFFLNFSLSESFLWGSADYTGAFYDVDDIVIDWSDGSRNKIYRNGDVTYSDSRGMFVPVTALDVKIGIKEGESYSLGIGAFGEFWHGLPIGPTLHRPWDIGNPVNAPSGMEWRIDSKTVKIYGLYFFVNATF